MAGLGCTAGRRPALNSDFAPAPPKMGQKMAAPEPVRRSRVEMLLAFMGFAAALSAAM
jgi:hypothetical protein